MRHARNAAVEAIENECDENCQCSLFKTTVHRLHNREETGKKRNRCQQIWQPVYAAAPDAPAFTQPFFRTFVHGSAELCEYCFGGVNLVADAHLGHRRQGQIQINAGTKADKTKTLPATEQVAALYVTKDASRNQACHLHAGYIAAVLHAYPERVTLIFNGRL